jgi:hypothetical protein
MSDNPEPTQEEKEAAARLVKEAIKRFQKEGDAKPNPLTQPVNWRRDSE